MPITSDYSRNHITNIIFIALIPFTILTFDYSRQLLPGNYFSLAENPIWMEGRQTNFEKHQIDSISDNTKYLADYYYLTEIRDGKSILWDNSTGSGTPFFARWDTRVVSLFSLPFYIFPFKIAFYISYCIKQIVLGINIYILATALQCLPATSTLISILVLFGGIIVFLPLHPFNDLIVWFPLYLLVLNKMLSRSLKFWILMCPIVFLMFTSGDLEGLILVLFFSLFYIILSSLIGSQLSFSLSSAVASLILSWILGLGLTSFVLFPYIEWSTLKSFFNTTTPYYVRMWDILGLFVPKGISQNNINIIKVMVISTPGLISILLIPFWISIRGLIRKNRSERAEILFLSGLILFLLGFCFILFKPSKTENDLLIFTRASWFFTFGVGFVIAIAVESWNIFTPEECRLSLKRLVFIIPISWFFLVVLTLSVHTISRVEINSFWKELLLAILWMAILGIYLVISLFSPAPKNAGYVICLFVIGNYLLLYEPYKVKTPFELVTPNPSVIDTIDMKNERVAFLDYRHYELYGIPVINMNVSPEKTTSRYDRFKNKSNLEPLLWNRSGVQKFILGQQLKALEKPREFINLSKLRKELVLTSVLSSGAGIFTTKEPGDRAFVLYKGKSIERDDESYLSANLPNVIEQAPIPDTAQVEKKPVEVVDISPTRVQVKVPKTSPGVLVLADTYYPGWNATVNGVPTRIFPVNLAFRGVELSEGDHVVEFTYNCRYLWWGAMVSSLVLIFILVLVKYQFNFSLRM